MLERFHLRETAPQEVGDAAALLKKKEKAQQRLSQAIGEITDSHPHKQLKN